MLPNLPFYPLAPECEREKLMSNKKMSGSARNLLRESKGFLRHSHFSVFLNNVFSSLVYVLVFSLRWGTALPEISLAPLPEDSHCELALFSLPLRNRLGNFLHLPSEGNSPRSGRARHRRFAGVTRVWNMQILQPRFRDDPAVACTSRQREKNWEESQRHGQIKHAVSFFPIALVIARCFSLIWFASPWSESKMVSGRHRCQEFASPTLFSAMLSGFLLGVSRQKKFGDVQKIKRWRWRGS